MRRQPRTILFITAFFGACGPSSDARGEVVFTWLEDLPNGVGNNGATGVSADGSVVVGSARTERGWEAFRWTAETGMVGLGDLPGGEFYSGARGVSGDGSTVVGISRSANSDPGWAEAFRWTAQTGMVGLGDFPGGRFMSWAHGVSGDGSVVVGEGEHGGPGSPNEAWRWEDGVMTGLGFLDSTRPTVAKDVSQDGSVVAGFGETTIGTEAFRWTQETGLVALGDLPGGRHSSQTRAISADGAVIVGRSDSARSENLGEAFRWTEAEGMIALGDLPGGMFTSEATGVSADGSIIVGGGHVGGNFSIVPFIWDAGEGMRDLRDLLVDWDVDLGEWYLAGTMAISGDGLSFAGTAMNAQYDTQAWVLTIPEPATLSLLALSALLILRPRPFRRRTQSR